MQGTDVLVPLAEIAGVFVGFGALIAVRSGDTMAVGEINSIRWVVQTGIWVVIVALAPIIISSYGVAGHQLWLVGSLLALALLVLMIVMYGRTPENRAELADIAANTPRAELVVQALRFWPPMALVVLAFALVVLGRFPDQEQALYLTAVALGLFLGAFTLLDLVVSQRHPLSPSDPAALSATGGPRA